MNVNYESLSSKQGLIIKEARLRNEYKTSELAKNICAENYLIKIEKGLIVPTSEIYTNLIKRLKIDVPKNYKDNYLKLFRNALYSEKLDEFSYQISKLPILEYERFILKFILAVINNENAKVIITLKHIRKFIHLLSPFELQNIYLFKGLHNLHLGHYQQAESDWIKSLELCKKENIVDPYLYYQLAKQYFRVQSLYYGFYYLKKATKEFEKLYLLKMFMKCKILFCLETIRQKDYITTKKNLIVIKKILSIQPDKDVQLWYEFINFSCNTNHKDDDEIRLFYERHISIGCGEYLFNVVLSYIEEFLSRQKNKDVIKLIDRLNMKQFSEQQQNLIDFYYYLVKRVPDSELLIFLKEDAIPLAKKHFDVYALELYKNTCIEIFKKMGSYKRISEMYAEWDQISTEIKRLGFVSCRLL